MTVEELIYALQDHNPDTKVLVTTTIDDEIIACPIEYINTAYTEQIGKPKWQTHTKVVTLNVLLSKAVIL